MQANKLTIPLKRPDSCLKKAYVRLQVRHRLRFFGRTSLCLVLPSSAQHIFTPRLEANKLSLLTLKDTGLLTVDAFKYVIMFAKHDIFEPSMAPFVSRSHGPTGLRESFLLFLMIIVLIPLTYGQCFSNQVSYIPGFQWEIMVWALLAISLTWQPDNLVFANFCMSHSFSTRQKSS